MTEIIKKPVPRVPLLVEWSEDCCFDVALAVSAPAETPALLPLPPLTPNDTGFLSTPPSPM
jgi:hypothetical protein